MKTASDAGPVVAPSNRSTYYFWLEDTLASYEVEELDGHELARLLPRIANGAEGREVLPAKKKV